MTDNIDRLLTVAGVLSGEASYAHFERLGFSLSAPSSYHLVAMVPPLEGGDGLPVTLDIGLVGRYAHFCDGGGYLELITLGDRSRFLGEYEPFLERYGPGWLKVSVGARSGATAFFRLVDELPELRAQPIWSFWRRSYPDPARGLQNDEMNLVGLVSSRELQLNINEQQTPQVNQVPALVDHANGARRLDAVTLLVDDLAQETTTYTRWLGLEPTVAASQSTFTFANSSALMITDDPAVPDPSLDSRGQGRPVVTAPTVAVADLERTRASLEQAGVTLRQGRGGGVVAIGEHLPVVFKQDERAGQEQ